jgi:catechol 2,3-dioxygenase-like lactoylglutathione lyase family enzyme
MVGLTWETEMNDPQRTAGRKASPLAARLQGVQHIGVTVQNMDRAFVFYTEVLGGTEIMRDGDFQGDRIHNTLLADQDIEARERRVNPATIGIPDLRSGAQRLDVRFIQFDNVVIELLQYRDAAQPAGSGDAFAEPLDHMSPAFPRMLHICFHLRDDVDFNQFIADLEAESARRGMTHVKANRVVTVTSDAERRATRDADRSQQQRHHRGSLERLATHLLQGPRRRAARVRAGARSGQATLRRRTRRSAARRRMTQQT